MYLSTYIQEQVINLKLAISNQSSSSKTRARPVQIFGMRPFFFFITTLLSIIASSFFSPWEERRPGPPWQIYSRRQFFSSSSLPSSLAGNWGLRVPRADIYSNAILNSLQSPIRDMYLSPIKFPYLYHQKFQAFLSLYISM